MEEKQFNQLMNVLNEIKSQQDSISKKLSILITPIFKRDSKKQDKKITRANIKKLHDCGLDYKEISNILGMSSGTVANELTVLRGKVRRKKNAKKS